MNTVMTHCRNVFGDDSYSNTIIPNVLKKSLKDATNTQGMLKRLSVVLAFTSLLTSQLPSEPSLQKARVSSWLPLVSVFQ
jgi:hypothetical protein